MKSVLVIDDEPDYRKLLAEVLEASGWTVFQAEEGEEGVRLAMAHQPLAVICDLLMSRGNGFQVCQAIRAHPSLANTKLVVCSGRDYDTDRKAAFAAGADEYLTKPLELSALISMMDGWAQALPLSREPIVSSDAEAQGTMVRFWGVRGSIPTPGPSTVYYGGNTTCVEVRAAGQIIVLDAGTGVRLLGNHLLNEFANKPLQVTLLLTHTHWDHIQGLPFFQPMYRPENQLRILGYEGARHGLDNVLSNQMESPFFPIGLRQVPANLRIEELREMSFDLGSVKVDACFANHPGVCVGYRLTTPAGSIAFFPDNEPRRAQRRSPQSHHLDAPANEFAYAQDRKFVEFLSGCDVLIMDTQYDCEEYKQYIGWGHGCVKDVVVMAVEAGVKRLYLFHHDPSHDDAKVELMEKQAKKLAAELGSPIRIAAAREGAVIELPAPVPAPA
jgi:phosphoribosyl 1,2-cyclic phosphodiesterase